MSSPAFASPKPGTWPGALFSPPSNLTTSSSPLPAPTLLGMSEFHASIFVPVISFWLVSGFYETLEYFDLFPSYRVVPTAEESKRNLVSRTEVARVSFTMHVVQMIFGLVIERYFPGATHEEASAWGSFGTVEWFGMEVVNGAAKMGVGLDARLAWTAARALYWSWLLLKQLGCFFILDTWGYWVHYSMHVSTYLYRTVHSIHHLNYVPYSFAGGYNHPVEGFSDILAAQVAVKVIGISHREAAFFYTVAALKAVDDHSGYMLPLNPFRFWRWVFGNGPVYHTVHHQRWGFKSNFEIFFCFWDHVNNTIYRGTRTLEDDLRKRDEKEAAQLKVNGKHE